MSQPSSIDLVTPFDPTSYSTLTGAQLEQFGAGIAPYVDKGFIMVTTDVGGVPQVPTANVTTKWQTYLWLQISPSSTSVALYAWNPNQSNANPNFLNWQPVTLSAIPSGSINGYQLAPSTVTYDKILNIQLSQVVGYTTLLTTVLTPSVQTVISGSYAAGFTINNGQCTLATLDTTGANKQVLTAQGAGVAPAWATPPEIYTGLANPNNTGSDDGKVVAVNSGAAGTYKYLPIASVGRILQIVETDDKTKSSTAGTATIASTALVYNATGMNALTGLNTAFTPISASSTLLIELSINVVLTNQAAAVGIYLATGATAPQAMSVISNTTVTNFSTLNLRFKLASPGTSALAFYIAWGINAGTAYYNSNDGATNIVGGVISSLKITEYL